MAEWARPFRWSTRADARPRPRGTAARRTSLWSPSYRPSATGRPSPTPSHGADAGDGDGQGGGDGNGGGTLPLTGAPAVMIGAVGAGVLLAGGAMLMVARRRRVVLVSPGDEESTD
ncbi:LPXTG cell wall anchor domain-containing protein [Micromonospora siamensis]|nr:LPXTG cell wall anchor domain-containing protein [Micromonospora siamensis]